MSYHAPHQYSPETPRLRIRKYLLLKIMQAPISLKFYFIFKVFSMLVQNVLLGTRIMHNPYLTKFTRSYKFQISKH